MSSLTVFHVCLSVREKTSGRNDMKGYTDDGSKNADGGSDNRVVCVLCVELCNDCSLISV